MSRSKDISLRILNLLMSSSKLLSTVQITNIIGCDRKAVYRAVDTLECCGFGIRIITYKDKKIPKHYEYVGLYGADEIG